MWKSEFIRTFKEKESSTHYRRLITKDNTIVMDMSFNIHHIINLRYILDFPKMTLSNYLYLYLTIVVFNPFPMLISYV